MLILHFQDQHNWPKNLSADNVHVVAQLGQNGWRVEIAAVCCWINGWNLTADHRFGALAQRIFHQRVNNLDLLGRTNCTDVHAGVTPGYALTQSPCKLAHGVDKLIVNGLKHNDAFRSHTVLAEINKGAANCRMHRLVDIGIITDNHRVFAAQLHDYRR